ncbi:lysine methyltransferase 5Ab isoform X2 [Gouania willdenowi]|nr:N-lysine methyltransferase KMT5A-A-like isoform X2 [Gouania willdenowi]
MLIQEANDLGGSNLDSSRLKKELPNEVKCESLDRRQQKPKHLKKDLTTDQNEPKQSSADVESATQGKVSASKSGRRAARKPEPKKMENKASNNRKVTDYYPIRRSNRKTKSELKNEEHKFIDELIKTGVEEGMQVKHMEGKGRGIFAIDGFRKGDFVVEYHGDLLELAEAKTREAQYAQDPDTGCYMYYFQYQSKTYCVDATRESSRLGRLINHSKNGNCHTRLHPIDGTPHLILVASRDIAAEEELLYDYGDRSKASVLAHPWLKH